MLVPMYSLLNQLKYFYDCKGKKNGIKCLVSRLFSSIKAFSVHLTRKQRNIFNFNQISLAKFREKSCVYIFRLLTDTNCGIG